MVWCCFFMALLHKRAASLIPSISSDLPFAKDTKVPTFIPFLIASTTKEINCEALGETSWPPITTPLQASATILKNPTFVPPKIEKSKYSDLAHPSTPRNPL